MPIKHYILIFSLLISILILNSCTNYVQDNSFIDVISEDINYNESNTRPKSQEDKLISNIENKIFDPSSMEILVNKQYSLDENYIPDDLVTLNVPTIFEDPEVNQLRAEAAEQLEEMFKAAEESDIILYSRSGYRSYKTQDYLFERYVSDYGEEAANLHSARAGESEHQTGLAVDVTSENVGYELIESFGETKEGIWVRENSHEYGFIIRYLNGKEEFTGYLYEPWHLRYLGKELATFIYESGISYEEYLIDRGIEIEIEK